MKILNKKNIVSFFTFLFVLATAILAFAEGEEAEYVSKFASTAWALFPPIVAIVLALITKEVYSSLFVGILSGALLYANFNLETAMNHMLVDGFIASLSDAWNVGILIFLVILGAIVALMNKAGGSAAFGK